MRAVLLALGGILAAASLSFAGEDEGTITRIDQDKMLIQLDDGKTYKLPGEFDMTSIEEGMTVLLAFDKIGEINLITDMEVEE